MKETVLVVDDTPTNLQVLVRFLAESGYRVLVAEDGAGALAQVARIQPDIILLDVTMPELDGFETCRKLKEQPGLEDVPVLFLTARSDITDRLKGFNAGAQDYLTKPVQKEEVIARLKTHLTILKQKRQLQSLVEERQRFMRIAAHDLRNILTIMSGFSEVGRMSPDSGQKDKCFHRISASCSNMRAIIDDFLCVNLLQCGQGGKNEAFQLDQIINQIFEQSVFAAGTKRITLARDLGGHPLTAMGHPAHTHQILSNFASNALKYSPPGTQVRFRARLNQAHWRIEIQDEGPGIPPDERDRLFVEFARISNKPTGGETSTGLGLFIVKTLAAAQGGRVGAEFPAGGGSIFWLELPAIDGA